LLFNETKMLQFIVFLRFCHDVLDVLVNVVLCVSAALCLMLAVNNSNTACHAAAVLAARRPQCGCAVVLQHSFPSVLYCQPVSA